MGLRGFSCTAHRSYVCVRFINGGDDVIWSAAAILTSFRPFRPIAAVVLMVAAVVVAAVTVASFVGALVAAASWAVSACILIEANFSLFSISVLISGCDHLANPLWRLKIEFGAKVVVMESWTKAVMTSAFVMLGIEFLISEKCLM